MITLPKKIFSNFLKWNIGDKVEIYYNLETNEVNIKNTDLIERLTHNEVIP